MSGPGEGLPTERTLTVEGEAAASPGGRGAPGLPARYRDLGRLAGGSFGEVRRVLDTTLERVVAMKILHAEHAARSRPSERFVEEVKLTAGLDHPGIVAVHDAGRLDDGRLWFTMREVRGRTLAEVIAGVPSAAGGWTFRRLVDAFARACQAVAFAHRRGVVHRDLKPANIMVGELGDVLVVDWGLGRRVAAPEEAGGAEAQGAGAGQERRPLTLVGDVLGTPAYMPPEQALGQLELHGPESDVYALGAILYHLLAGRPPYQGDAASVLAQVIAGPPVPVVEAAGPRRPPGELVLVCERAMSRLIGERHPDAEALAAGVVAWLDGAQRRERALAVVDRARALEPEIAGLKARAAALRAEARGQLDGLPSFAPVASKRAGWALEDEAARLGVQAALREAQWFEALNGALTVDPELPEAHAALAAHHRERLVAAEQAHRDEDAVRAEAQLRAHDRGEHAAFLRGEGELTVVTDPPGAVVRLERYARRDRRLVTEDLGVLGATPLRAVTLPRGSYRLRLLAPGRAEALYPVLIERGEHWTGLAPGEREPQAIRLLDGGELGAGECHVPAGWCWSGGEAGAAESLPARRLWVDAFVVQRFPVTNGAFLEFLDDLVACGREAEAIEACPRPHPAMPGHAGELLYRRDAAGRFALGPVAGDASGQVWERDWPVVLVDWHGATAYARWLAARTGKPWRLPDEIEREKAARGVDGRSYPWGDHFDANWACVLDSHEGDPVRVGVGRYPLDESPYGVRGLAGNVRDWCANVWTREGPPAPGGRLRRLPAAADDPGHRAVRGGAWTSRPELSRAEARFASRPDMRWTTTGLRLVRSV